MIHTPGESGWLVIVALVFETERLDTTLAVPAIYPTCPATKLGLV